VRLCSTVPPQLYNSVLGGGREVHGVAIMQGCSIHWHGISGVPGLGCPVSNHYTNTAILRLWEEGEEEGNTKKSFSKKVAKLFSFRNSKTVEKISSVPQKPVRRSLSAVTVSQRRKVFPCTGTEDLDYKNKIKRSVSLVKVKNSKVENEKDFVRESENEMICDYVAQNSEGTQADLKNNNKSQATQTDKVHNNNNEDYDYVYSNWISPAMIIKLAEQLQDDCEEDADNIYEEINPKERNVGPSNCLLDMNRNQLLAKKLADLDIRQEKNTSIDEDEDNYIRPQTIKKEIEKKIQKQKSKGSKNVTFNDSGRKLNRSKSLIASCQQEIYSDHNTVLTF